MQNKTMKLNNDDFVISVLDTIVELTEMIHFEKSLDIVYEKTIKKISALFNWEYGELWTYDDQRNILKKSPIYYANSTQAKKFGMHSKELSFTYGEGLPGATWKLKKSIWTQNVQNEKNL